MLSLLHNFGEKTLPRPSIERPAIVPVTWYLYQYNKSRSHDDHEPKLSRETRDTGIRRTGSETTRIDRQTAIQ
jgi:hypothetical protein